MIKLTVCTGDETEGGSFIFLEKASISSPEEACKVIDLIRENVRLIWDQEITCPSYEDNLDRADGNAAIAEENARGAPSVFVPTISDFIIETLGGVPAGASLNGLLDLARDANFAFSESGMRAALSALKKVRRVTQTGTLYHLVPEDIAAE